MNVVNELLQYALDLITIGELDESISCADYEFGAVIEDGHLKGFERN